MTRSSRTISIAAISFVAFATAIAPAATEEQKNAVKAIEAGISNAGKLFLEKKFRETSDAVRKIEKDLETVLVGADRATINLLKPQYDRLKRAHILLELEGYSLPTLVLLKAITGDSNPPKPTGVSFVSHVAPILISKCGRCHVNKASGKFSAATFEGLMKGSSAGTVIFAGNPDGSQLIVSIEDGDMPRGGLKISAAELATLKKWISEGAKFDGNDPKANIAVLKPGDEPVAKVDIPPPAASSGPSFGRHVAPILVQNCSGCHVNAQRLRGGLNMTTFQGLMRGGNTEPPVKPNDSAGSLLIRKLKGMGGGQRMPPGGPLSATAIARIEKWIDDGAKFDGKDPGQPIEEVADFARAQLSSGTQLSEDREEAAIANWNLTMSGIKAYTAKTDNFLLVGNIGERALATFGEQAEMVLPKVAGILGAPSTKPLIKGRMTLFVFQQRYDYSEFGRMIEKRKPPLGSRGHWRFSLIDAYGAMISPRNAEEYSMEVMIGQQLAGAYVEILAELLLKADAFNKLVGAAGFNTYGPAAAEDTPAHSKTSNHQDSNSHRGRQVKLVGLFFLGLGGHQGAGRSGGPGQRPAPAPTVF
ncbi:MAG: hypothetical protein IH991_05710 [Planctomycetes bacterium]|nr:hypothetical protein [Planctomycetota bacterium]